MRKIIVSMNITLDGFMAGAHGELDWHFSRWTEEMAECLGIQLSHADTILLGRNTYAEMACYWPLQANNLAIARDDVAFAYMMNGYTKVVFSKTLEKLHWQNTILIKGSLNREIRKLKQKEGRDIIVFGSGQLVAGLSVANLIDEYILWLHPVFLGSGRPLFKNLRARLNMQLTKVKQFRSGVVVLYYSRVIVKR